MTIVMYKNDIIMNADLTNNDSSMRYRLYTTFGGQDDV